MGELLDPLSVARSQIADHFVADEEALVANLLERLVPAPESAAIIADRAKALINVSRRRIDLFQRFQQIYDLGGSEGGLLLGLAEALPRIPDGDTALRLVNDTFKRGHWRDGAGKRHGSKAIARSFELAAYFSTDDSAALLSAPRLKIARYIINKLAGHFVFAETITAALHRAGKQPSEYFSYDMLGEAAITPEQADCYFAGYLRAIDAVAAQARPGLRAHHPPTISVKLSALSPRFEITKREQVLTELKPKLLELAVAARHAQVQLTLDAEEAERLDLSLDLFEAVYRSPQLAGWAGFGLAVQAYQKRALPLINWLLMVAKDVGKPIPVRLVKGAYWDTEIKRAQQTGIAGFPVYTRKAATDLAYLVCAQTLLEADAAVIPQFATHNAHTIAFILSYRRASQQFEFQRLHGMGQTLYAEVTRTYGVPCRVYAPIGSYQDLLPYLLRRLLENGANSSFLNQLLNPEIDLESLAQGPEVQLRRCKPLRNPNIVLPADIYRPDRSNSRGISFADTRSWEPLDVRIKEQLRQPPAWVCRPRIGGQDLDGQARTVFDPSAINRSIGTCYDADSATADLALHTTAAAFAPWTMTPVGERAAILERTADSIESHTASLIALLVREAGRCIPDAYAELREAVDLLRYYAAESRKLLTQAVELPSPSGESNTLSLHGRGVFLCISPWNFPLAIFFGQIAAALVTGNTVIAKPAEQTSLIASHAIQLFFDSGLPPGVLALLPGDGPSLGERLLADGRLAGVCLTGSTDTAKAIQRRISSTSGPIIPLIAETGGINALIADSSAHPEQLVQDCIWSAFNSAGQRCSALRLLVIQEDIADRVLKLLAGMVATLEIGDPAYLHTDIGPVIDANALETLTVHRDRLEQEGRRIATASLSSSQPGGHFFAPCIYEIPDIAWLDREVFGPILHVVRYRSNDVDSIVDALNSKAYGLTFGIHSRIRSVIENLQHRVRAGNIYVNRNMIGAVVGTQPFGGERLSGTGPKAGGPNYLLRFMTERTVTTNTAAIGGDTRLLSEAG